MIVDGVKAYKAIFGAVSKRIGREMAVAITAFDEDSINTSDPVSSIREFLIPVIAMFGDNAVRRMMAESLAEAFTERYAQEIIEELVGTT